MTVLASLCDLDYSYNHRFSNSDMFVQLGLLEAISVKEFPEENGDVHSYNQQEGNCLARLGSQQDEDLIVTANVSLAAREFVLVDALGVGHLRTYLILSFWHRIALFPVMLC
ncbi:hypothetical protein RHMOL_Rhmol06G0235800 [Rhododendron molle]|uniref:Uncharacterized protein n=1 Tax=Rhododendron molle TaxID=49168 RepID=A0ACC0NFV6_RHOML|nr:hypothetical protein RHMOL_Rhmol06G0235800 [Rhododendron molle]